MCLSYLCVSDRIVKIPDVHGTLPFVLCGSCPPYVHAVKKGKFSLFVMIKKHMHVVTYICEVIMASKTIPNPVFSINIHACHSELGNALHSQRITCQADVNVL